MLRVGQKVQVSKICMHYFEGVCQGSSTSAGKITRITEVLGMLPSVAASSRYGGLKEYYMIACSNTRTARGSLYPIDDEPCEEEFLEEFKHLIKDNNTCKV